MNKKIKIRRTVTIPLEEYEKLQAKAAKFEELENKVQQLMVNEAYRANQEAATAAINGLVRAHAGRIITPELFY